MKVYTYLLQSILKERYYTGISKHPEERLIEHNRGKVPITAKNRPYILTYIKVHDSYKEARKQEKWLKKKNKEYKDKISKK